MEQRHWHVTVTMGGAPVEPMLLRPALLRFADEHVFLSSLRFVSRGAEFSYWEEGRSMHEVATLALHVWHEHQASAGLPPWEVVGLEILDRDSYRVRPTADLTSLIGAQEIRLSL